MAKNKVEFGISNLHVGTYEVSGNTVTLGTPYHQPGAVNFSPSEDSNENNFYADNIAYFSEYSDGATSGDITVALFDPEFKTQFLGYKTTGDGGLAKVKNAVKPKTYVAFEVDGDKEKRRVIYYNCALGSITREYTTIEDAKTPNTETLSMTSAGDSVSGVVCTVYKPGDAGYDTLFTAPTAPTIATNP